MCQNRAPKYLTFSILSRDYKFNKKINLTNNCVCPGPGLNRRPPRYKHDALPTELPGHNTSTISLNRFFKKI